MKKFIGPLLSVVGYLAYLLFIFAFVFADATCPLLLKVFLGMVGVIYLVILIWVLKIRFLELKKGEVEDAVSKY